MNMKALAYEASTLERARINRFARKVARETKLSPTWSEKCKGETFQGWLLTKRERFSFRSHHDWEDGIYSVKEEYKSVEYFLSTDGRLLKYVYVCMRNMIHPLSNGRYSVEAEDKRTSSCTVERFKHDDYLLFDCPPKIEKYRSYTDTVGVENEDNLEPDRERPYYDQKGVGISLLMKKSILLRGSSLDGIIDA